MKMNKTTLPVHIRKLYTDAITKQEKSLYQWVTALEQLLKACRQNGTPVFSLTKQIQNLAAQLTELYLIKRDLWPTYREHTLHVSDQKNVFQKLQHLLNRTYPASKSVTYKLATNYTLFLAKTMTGRKKKIGKE